VLRTDRCCFAALAQTIQALDAALQHAPLLQQQLQRTNLLSRESDKDILGECRCWQQELQKPQCSAPPTAHSIAAALEEEEEEEEPDNHLTNPFAKSTIQPAVRVLEPGEDGDTTSETSGKPQMAAQQLLVRAQLVHSIVSLSSYRSIDRLVRPSAPQPPTSTSCTLILPTPSAGGRRAPGAAAGPKGGSVCGGCSG